MKKQDLILLLTGIGIGYLVFSKKGLFSRKHQSQVPVSAGIDSELLVLGGKGLEIKGLQKSVNLLLGKGSVPVTGTYDKSTRDAVSKLFWNTSALVNPETGSVKKNFVTDLDMLFVNASLITDPAIAGGEIGD